MATVGFMAPQKHGPFTAPASFMNLPFSAEPEGALAAFLGVPFDCGMHPTRIGATAREGLEFLQELAGIDFVSFDINTVSPPHDSGGMTAFLAATVALECLTLACYSPSIRDRIDGPPSPRE